MTIPPETQPENPLDSEQFDQLPVEDAAIIPEDMQSSEAIPVDEDAPIHKDADALVIPVDEDAPIHKDADALVIPVQDGTVTDEFPLTVRTDAPENDERHFEDLTVAEMLGQLRRSPQMTLQAIRQISRTARTDDSHVTPIPHSVQIASAGSAVMGRDAALTAQSLDTDQRREAFQLGLRLTALVVAWWGSGILANAPLRTEELALNVGAPYLFLAFFIWLGAEIYGSWPQIRHWGVNRQPETVEPQSEPKKKRPVVWSGFHPVKVLLALLGLFCSIIALRFTTNNQFTFIGFWSWMASVALWVSAVAPAGWSIPAAWGWLREQVARINVRQNWVLWLLVLITLLGAVFRMSDAAGTPPEMTSDHVEKILDSQRVLDGNHQVFFPNNGGREAFQMYAMALFSQIPGMGMDFTTLKLLTAVEGLVAVVLIYWLGRTVIGTEDERLARIVGLIFAALVAVSYWHTALSRLGLRIVLTTVVTTLLLIYLARAMRDNQRGDYIKAGLVLGFGLYTYQAVRMLPVVIIVGVALIFIFKVRSWRRAGSTLMNFLVLVLVAFVVFVPLFSYSLQYPQDFWRRTSGRLVGDDAIQEEQEDGSITLKDVTIPEQIQLFVDSFVEHWPVLQDNIRNALLMFNWKGDVAWINAAPNRPAMDVFTGALFVVGLAAWLARMIRRRDVFDWSVPLILFIMLLPSALSVAFPVENPSHTRTSGALPTAYLIAALPLGLIVFSMGRVMRRQTALVVSGVLVSFIILGAYNLNSRIYFNDYRASYLNSSLPYSEAGAILRGFAESDGSYGNAFMIGYPFWWDHRAVGIEAGRTDWPNGIVSRDSIQGFLGEASRRTDQYRLDPERDLLFFYASEDTETEALLQRMFPAGYATLRESYQEGDDYKIFRVPRLGSQGFDDYQRQEFPLQAAG